MSTRLLAYRVTWGLIVLSLIAGMTTPMLTFTRFYVFNDSYSLIAGIFHLLEEGEPVLFIIVLGFSVILPAYKMILLYRLIPAIHHTTADKQQRALIARLDIIGKWSMLDVFVIAVLIVMIKLAAVASIQTHYGLYLFSAAVIASMIFTHRLNAAMVK